LPYALRATRSSLVRVSPPSGRLGRRLATDLYGFEVLLALYIMAITRLAFTLGVSVLPAATAGEVALIRLDEQRQDLRDTPPQQPESCERGAEEEQCAGFGHCRASE